MKDGPGQPGPFSFARTQSRRYRFSQRSTAQAEIDDKRDPARTVECVMRFSWKAVLTALLVAGGATTMSACASAQGYGYDSGYYGNGYYDNGHSDPNGYDYGYGDLPNGGVSFS